ncbi:MAG: WYL domain-containing protein [Clostridia bacterium]|nr:WYL domain-containing protein [Clostridia bacterium]
MENESRLRLLHIYDILTRETDENHPMSTVQIIDNLKKRGIAAHRTTVGSDINVLQEFGIDIVKINSTQNKYFVSSRRFELPEIKLLIGAVESSRLLTPRKTDILTQKLLKEVSIYEAEDIRKNICYNDEVKPNNEKVHYIIDVITEAIELERKISFQYFYYNGNKEKCLRHGGEIYTLSPHHLVWNGDYYYVVGYSHKYSDVGAFRIDRIAGAPQILEERSAPMPKGFDIKKHMQTAFRMFGGTVEIVELACANETMGAVIDKFGEDAATSVIDRTTFKVTAQVCTGPTFYRWVFSFGGQIKILSPSNVKEEYAKAVTAAYEAL